ncbi:c-type cytochrome [Epibacterium ulvae]|uniref:c-type cytochrome n=1 Tax=Epibacterium ulvae TaxID=1156985 RepID=UPI001BFC6A2A|nr:c-type cytochrome [Epibacterium ulvae]MBT8154756.1 c-type cytochrome [Epibacterium ulvae]
MPQDAVLQDGRVVWEDTCQACHGGNRLTGAPKITATDAWSPRIEQGLAVLFDHAINGFTGPKYTQMPPRGSNEDLSDAQVQAAVRFMVWASGGDTLATE